MPKITILPHEQLCPEGAVIEDAPVGESICDVLLDHHIDIDHACEKSCACTTCHVIIRQGFDSLEEASELEEDLLDQAWGAGSGFAFELPSFGGRRGFGGGNSEIHHQPCARTLKYIDFSS